MSQRTKKIVSEFQSLLRSRFAENIVRLTLFGSHARGEEGPDSDIDVLVIVKRFSRRLENDILEAAYEVMWANGFRPLLSVHIMDEAYFARLEELESSFVNIVRHDGIPL
jgi:predicted nucleotidyltransferase